MPEASPVRRTGTSRASVDCPSPPLPQLSCRPCRPAVSSEWSDRLDVQRPSSPPRTRQVKGCRTCRPAFRSFAESPAKRPLQQRSERDWSPQASSPLQWPPCGISRGRPGRRWRRPGATSSPAGFACLFSYFPPSSHPPRSPELTPARYPLLSDGGVRSLTTSRYRSIRVGSLTSCRKTTAEGVMRMISPSRTLSPTRIR